MISHKKREAFASLLVCIELLILYAFESDLANA